MANIRNAKHAKAQDGEQGNGSSKLARTGDFDEVFWIGGVAFVAAGTVAASAAARRRAKHAAM